MILKECTKEKIESSLEKAACLHKTRYRESMYLETYKNTLQ